MSSDKSSHTVAHRRYHIALGCFHLGAAFCLGLGFILVATTSVLSAWFVFAGPVPPLDGWERPFVMDRTRAAAELVNFTVIVVSVAIIVRRRMTMVFWAVCLAAVLMIVSPI